MLMAGDTSSHVTYIHAGRPKSRMPGHRPLSHHAIELVTRSAGSTRVSAHARVLNASTDHISRTIVPRWGCSLILTDREPDHIVTDTGQLLHLSAVTVHSVHIAVRQGP